MFSFLTKTIPMSLNSIIDGHGLNDRTKTPVSGTLNFDVNLCGCCLNLDRKNSNAQLHIEQNQEVKFYLKQSIGSQTWMHGFSHLLHTK